MERANRTMLQTRKDKKGKPYIAGNDILSNEHNNILGISPVDGKLMLRASDVVNVVERMEAGYSVTGQRDSGGGGGSVECQCDTSGIESQIRTVSREVTNVEKSVETLEKSVTKANEEHEKFASLIHSLQNMQKSLQDAINYNTCLVNSVGEPMCYEDAIVIDYTARADSSAKYTEVYVNDLSYSDEVNRPLSIMIDWGDGATHTGNQNSANSRRYRHDYENVGYYRVHVEIRGVDALFEAGGGYTRSSLLATIFPGPWFRESLTDRQNYYEAHIDYRGYTAIPVKVRDGSAVVRDIFNFSLNPNIKYICGFSTYYSVGSIGIEELNISRFAICQNAEIMARLCTFNNGEPYETLLYPFRNLRNIYHMFESSHMTTLPKRLFSQNLELENCTWALASSKITEVPEGLFACNVKLKNLYYMFYGCKALTTVPSDLLQYCSMLEDTRSMFMSCSKLEAPDEFYIGAPMAQVRYDYMFSDVKKRPTKLVFTDGEVTTGFY